MKKITLFITLLFGFICTESVLAQVGLRKVSLRQQIEESSLVVEGKVVSKNSFWDSDHKLIYTSNTVEVYKVFKGNPIQTIEVITIGGVVGLTALDVSHSLKLQKGSTGVFTLYDNNIKTKSGGEFLSNQFRPYGSSQGFYKYNLFYNTVVNSFNKRQGISISFYNEIMSFTKKEFIEMSSFDSQLEKSSSTKKVLAPSAITFTPTTTSAGTKSIITISIPGGAGGTDFGGTKGKVAFSNADDGGATFIDALDTQVTWSNTSITVEVPHYAGTGKIRVTNSDASSIVSTTDLTITYAETNVVYDADDTTDGMGGGSNGPLEAFAYIPQHVNINGSGGYTWQMHTDFDANAAAKAGFERAFNKWICETGINWTIGSTTTIDVAAFESTPPAPSAPPVNVIRFDNGSELGPTTLGVCYSWYKGCSIGGGSFQWFVAELDIVFDDATDWNFGPGATPAIVGKYDFESVALHELGHGHQLGHTIDTNNDVMHWVLQFAEDQRDLNANNITAANNVQNRNNGPTAVCSQPFVTDRSCPLSVEEDELNNAISLYPNPAKDQFYINNASYINLQKAVIYDISGRLISEHDISNTSKTKTIKIPSASKGIYFVNIHSDSAMITKKMVLD